MDDNKYFTNIDFIISNATKNKNYDFSTITDEEITHIVKKYIEDIDAKLKKEKIDQKYIIPDSQNDIKNRFININSSTEEDKIILKNNLVQNLLNSSDESTKNLGKILSFLHENNLSLYSKLYELVIDRISFSNGELIFVDGRLDIFRTDSCIHYLQFALSKEETKPLAEAFIVDLINGTNHDYEFTSLLTFLKNFTSFPDLDRLNEVLDFMKDCYEHGSKEHTIDNLRKMVNLIINGLSFQTARDSGYYDPSLDGIFLDDICCTSVVTFHEFGHAIDAHYSHRDKTRQNRELFAKAREHFLNHPSAISIIKKIAKIVEKKGEQIEKAFDKQMIKTHGSYDKALDYFESYIIDSINNGTLEQLFIDYNMPDNLVNDIKDDLQNGMLDTREIAKTLYNLAKYNLVDRAEHNMHETSFLDIISSIFGGYDITLNNGNIVSIGFGHDSSYFSREPDLPMCEIYANINSLLIHGKTNFLNLIRELFGEELYEYIMNDHNSDRIPDYVPDDGSRKKAV